MNHISNDSRARSFLAPASDCSSPIFQIYVLTITIKGITLSLLKIRVNARYKFSYVLLFKEQMLKITKALSN